MFACSQVLRPRLLPEEEGIDWDKVKKKKLHNDHFKSHYHPISLFTKKVLKNTEKLQVASWFFQRPLTPKKEVQKKFEEQWTVMVMWETN